MSLITKILQSETPEDVILFAVRSESGISYPRLDGLYSRNGWVNIGNNLELMKLVRNMALGGLVVYKDLTLIKGPNWRRPTFLTENKYTFE